MATVTFEVDEEMLEQARREASRRGTSVEIAAMERVRELAGTDAGRVAKARRQLVELTEKYPLRFPDGRIPNREERNAR